MREVRLPPSPLGPIDPPERQKASLDNQAITGLALFLRGAGGAENGWFDRKSGFYGKVYTQ